MAAGIHSHSPHTSCNNAEANILSDPEAADLAFGAPWRDIVMLGLDATEKCLMSIDHMQRYVRMRTTIGLSLTAYASLSSGHNFLLPIHHLCL